MISYEVFLLREVYDELAALDEALEFKVLSYIDLLSENPFLEGNLVEYSPTARRDCQIKVLGTVALYYWVDHADKEVRIVKLVSTEDLLEAP